MLPRLACGLWTLAVGVMHAVDQAVGQRDRIAFTRELTLPERRSLDDDHDFVLKVGQFLPA